MLVHVLKVIILAASVNNHKVVVIIVFGDDTIIIYATLVIHDQRKGCLAWGKSSNIGHSKSLEEGSSIFTYNANLTHVRYIEQTNTVSAMQMLFYNAIRIKNGHVITSEGDHLCLQYVSMVGMEMGTLKSLSGKLSDNLAQHLISLYI